MKKNLKLFLLAMLLCHIIVSAQNIAITGKVTGQENENLSGVTIKISGTKQGVATDAAGNYTITAPANAALIFSYIGPVTLPVMAIF